VTVRLKGAIFTVLTVVLLSLLANRPPWTPANAQSEQVAESPGNVTEIKAIFFDIGSTLVNTKTQSWLPGVQEGLKTLRSRGMPIGLISNTYGNSREKLLKNYLPPDFQFSDFVPSMVILSDEVNMDKSNPKIWVLAAERTNETIEHCAFVGENPKEIAGAQQAGMQAILWSEDTEAGMKALIELMDRKN
jgi:FMN phosphatase YigB (HAD superfamily)